MNKKISILKYRAILGIALFLGAILFTWGGHVINYERDDSRRIFSPQEYNPSGLHPTHNINTTSTVEIVGREDVVFMQPEFRRPILSPISAEYKQQLMNFSYLTNRIFLVDPSTILLPSDINVPYFLEADLTIDTSVDGPLVLVFHAHSGEMFIDSDPNNPMTGVMGVGRYLAEILTNQYGIETIHYTGRFDFVDGRPHRPGSYERMEPVIRQILEDNPSIQVVIDLHRDGVGEHLPPFVTYIDGVRTAQIMFFNGLSRQNRSGQVTALEWLYNPYQQENLNFSFRLQLAANQLYPGITRRIYLRAFRYSLHMLPLSTLVEIGNQHNTLQDALNAMHPLANIIAAVVT